LYLGCFREFSKPKPFFYFHYQVLICHIMVSFHQ
jgi:hypothetical protein